MERTIYIVKSKTRKGDVIADFDTYVEAVDCAIEELRKKPYIEACYFDDEHEGLDTCQGTETVWTWADYLAENGIETDFEEVEEIIIKPEEDAFTFEEYLVDAPEDEEEIDYFSVDDVEPSLEVDSKLVEGYTIDQLNTLNDLCAKYGVKTFGDLERCMTEYNVSDPLRAMQHLAADVGPDFIPLEDDDALENLLRYGNSRVLHSKDYDLDRMVEDLETYEADNAVVDCKVNNVIAHSEDEKPVDCKMEKAPLEKPLTEDLEEGEFEEEDFEEYDEPTECTWCGEVFSRDQLRKEVDLGYLCSRCEAAIKSRGEKLTFIENDYFDRLDEAQNKD